MKFEFLLSFLIFLDLENLRLCSLRKIPLTKIPKVWQPCRAPGILPPPTLNDAEGVEVDGGGDDDDGDGDDE